MRVLVTGGAGFVGSHVVDALVEAGHGVRVLDLRAGDVAAREGVECVTADVRDGGALEAALDGVDAVCHQAAMVGLGIDLDDIAGYVSHNDLGTAVLLRALARRSFRGPLVQASSMVVYGEGRYACREHGVVRPAPRSVAALAAGDFEPPCPACGAPLEAAAVAEDAPPDPRNVYAATKLHQEHLAAAFARETGVAVTSLRYHNVYGPRMPRDTPYAGVASIFLSALTAGRVARVFEDGAQRRDFVHVRDVARANLLALQASEPRCGALNVASGSPRTVGEMARALRAAVGDGAHEPCITGEFRLGDVRHVFASASAARRELGFGAVEDFAEGMAELAREAGEAAVTTRSSPGR